MVWKLKNIFNRFISYNSKKKVFHIDLSFDNLTVKTETEFNNVIFFEKKLKKIQNLNLTKIIAGGYLDKRALYTSDIYNIKKSAEKRNIHLGVDFWLPESTPVHSLFEGEIICSIYQRDHKGYGGFLILKQATSGQFISAVQLRGIKSYYKVIEEVLIKRNGPNWKKEYKTKLDSIIQIKRNESNI